jgi:hypothetical protein
VVGVEAGTLAARRHLAPPAVAFEDGEDVDHSLDVGIVEELHDAEDQELEGAPVRDRGAVVIGAGAKASTDEGDELVGAVDTDAGVKALEAAEPFEACAGGARVEADDAGQAEEGGGRQGDAEREGIGAAIRIGVGIWVVA